MNKFKRAAAAVLASAMVLALTACDEETPAAGSNASVWLASYQTGSFLAFACLVTRQTGYCTDSRRNRPLPAGSHGCPVR